MIPKTYQLLLRCVEVGVASGMRRAYKHTDTPGEDYIKEAITDAVMLEICEWFEFPPIGELKVSN